MAWSPAAVVRPPVRVLPNSGDYAARQFPTNPATRPGDALQMTVARRRSVSADGLGTAVRRGGTTTNSVPDLGNMVTALGMVLVRHGLGRSQRSGRGGLPIR